MAKNPTAPEAAPIRLARSQVTHSVPDTVKILIAHSRSLLHRFDFRNVNTYILVMLKELTEEALKNHCVMGKVGYR